MPQYMTLNHLVNTSSDPFSGPVVEAFIAADTLTELRRSIQHRLPALDWEAVQKQILNQVETLLDKPLWDILYPAWEEHDDVKKFIHEQSFDEDGVLGIAVLTDHELRSSYAPTIDINLNGDSQGVLCFFLGVKLDLIDITLKINKGKIEEVLSGTINGHIILQHQNATFIDQSFINKNIADLKHPIKHASVDQILGASDFGDNSISVKLPSKPTYHRPKTTEYNNKKSNIIQFLLGIAISLMAIFLFWLLQ